MILTLIYFGRNGVRLPFLLVAAVCSLLSCDHKKVIENKSLPVKLDQEIKENSKAINSSTQSLNRYSSSLRSLQTAYVSLDQEKHTLSLSLEDEEKSKTLRIEHIDLSYLVPLLPYKQITGNRFDIANLVLAEYSRNGISIPLQHSNEQFATVEYSEGLFNENGEYVFTNGQYLPNSGILPKRISVVNNCLRPGLWELNASDAVGEMFHAWIELDNTFYKTLLASQTHVAFEAIPEDFDNPQLFQDTPLEIDKLRKTISALGTHPIVYNDLKEIGSYSSQDSRRKVQRKFYDIKRGDRQIAAKVQSELADGDYFSMFSFQEPGIYNPNVRNNVVFERKWKKARAALVDPLTYYKEDQDFLPSKYLELVITNEREDEALVIGNIPLALLSVKNDFIIPSFGVGVLLSSELIERRLLRQQQGPRPSFAYLTKVKEGLHYIQNNHLVGYEQIFLRTVRKGDDLYLRCTIVSYERITDLLEFEVLIPKLQNALAASSSTYSPPLYETYRDDNTL